MRTNKYVQRHFHPAAILLLSAAVLAAGCNKSANVEDVKFVRTVTAERALHETPISMTGEIKAHMYINAAFRLSGKIVERMVSVGDVVKANQPLARLDSKIEEDSLAAAEAEVKKANANLEQTVLVEKRAGILVQSKAVSQNDYDEALRQLKSTKAQAQEAEARLHVTQEQLGFTILKAETGGVVTEKAAEVGEVVSVGQTVMRIADTKSTDAVFDMPEDVMRRGLAMGQKMRICLDADHTVCADSTVYETAPQADQVTRTYLVKAVLKNVPRQIFLGATVVGTLQLSEEPSIRIPASALTALDGKPAVWLVAPATKTVHPRAITVERYTADAVVVADGIQTGDIVVTAGVQSLYQDQKVTWQGEDHGKN